MRVLVKVGKITKRGDLYSPVMSAVSDPASNLRGRRPGGRVCDCRTTEQRPYSCRLFGRRATKVCLTSSIRARIEMDPALKTALANLIPVILGVLATGLVGSGLGFWWNLQLKNRQSDLATVKMFHDSYVSSLQYGNFGTITFVTSVQMHSQTRAVGTFYRGPPLPKAGWKPCSWASRPNIGLVQLLWNFWDSIVKFISNYAKRSETIKRWNGTTPSTLSTWHLSN
jgi:hypothetical protein